MSQKRYFHLLPLELRDGLMSVCIHIPCLEFILRFWFEEFKVEPGSRLTALAFPSSDNLVTRTMVDAVREGYISILESMAKEHQWGESPHKLYGTAILFNQIEVCKWLFEHRVQSKRAEVQSLICSVDNVDALTWFDEACSPIEHYRIIETCLHNLSMRTTSNILDHLFDTGIAIFEENHVLMCIRAWNRPGIEWLHNHKLIYWNNSLYGELLLTSLSFVQWVTSCCHIDWEEWKKDRLWKGGKILDSVSEEVKHFIQTINGGKIMIRYE